MLNHNFTYIRNLLLVNLIRLKMIGVSWIDFKIATINHRKFFLKRSGAGPMARLVMKSLQLPINLHNYDLINDF